MDDQLDSLSYSLMEEIRFGIYIMKMKSFPFHFLFNFHCPHRHMYIYTFIFLFLLGDGFNRSSSFLSKFFGVYIELQS